MERWRQKALTILMSNRTVDAKSVSEEESRVFRRAANLTCYGGVVQTPWTLHVQMQARVDNVMCPVPRFVWVEKGDPGNA